MSFSSPLWNKETIEGLVEGLAKHEKSIKVDKEHFYSLFEIYPFDHDILSAFYPVDGSKNSPQEYENRSLSVDGLIVNLRARQASIGLIPLKAKGRHETKSIFEDLWDKYFPKKYFPKKPTDYSIDTVLKDLMSNEEMVNVLLSDPYVPFTLLARLKTIDDVNKIEYNKPVIVKPGLDSFKESIIYDWEKSNTKTKKLDVSL